MYNVKLLPSAKQDIDRIFFYIADDLAKQKKEVVVTAVVYSRRNLNKII